MDTVKTIAELPHGIICVIRASDPDEALTIARGVRAAGVDAVEITFTVPGAVDVIAELSRAAASGAAIGAGTVRTTEQAAQALSAGAMFLVSPDLERGVVAAAHAAGLPAVPGALTPNEVGECLKAEATYVKIFPVGSVGGASYVRAIAEPFPEARWVVSGGITIDEVPAFMQVGCHAVCLGGALIDRRAAAAADVDGVAAHAASVLGQLAP